MTSSFSLMLYCSFFLCPLPIYYPPNHLSLVLILMGSVQLHSTCWVQYDRDVFVIQKLQLRSKIIKVVFPTFLFRNINNWDFCFLFIPKFKEKNGFLLLIWCIITHILCIMKVLFKCSIYSFCIFMLLNCYLSKGCKQNFSNKKYYVLEKYSTVKLLLLTKLKNIYFLL